jgi:AraC family transcriptional regulator, regulatory protein of adaptative response / methylated-DNA-[protein]-cysteine methyltransferase
MQTQFKNDERWNLVLARDANADGQFVYAVKSTGVFCRPSCPSRRPRRENVEFFNSPALAQEAGYRSCHRCVPTRPNLQRQMVEAACRYLNDHLESTVTLETLSRHVGVSPFYFQRLFKRTLGISPRQYQQAQRANRFKNALRDDGRITDAIYNAGYSSSSRAYDNIPGQLGMTPSAFRRNGHGTVIRYSILSTQLGKLLIATTERGLCAVRFGDRESALISELRREFRAASISRDDQALQPVAGQVQALLRAGATTARIPLDIQGTAFQQQVWNKLREIPRGETRSYAEIAKAIGRPAAVRAVASACASNPVALVVPCHRVVQKNGSLAGYRWGMKRKAALLETEGASPQRARAV